MTEPASTNRRRAAASRRPPLPWDLVAWVAAAVALSTGAAGEVWVAVQGVGSYGVAVVGMVAAGWLFSLIRVTDGWTYEKSADLLLVPAAALAADVAATALVTPFATAPRWLTWTVAIVCFGALVYVLWRLDKARARESKVLDEQPPGHLVAAEHLAMLLSPPTVVLDVDWERADEPVRLTQMNRGTGVVSSRPLPLDDLEAAIDSFDGFVDRHNWRQALRVLRPHVLPAGGAARLRSVTVVTSGPNDGCDGERPKIGEGAANSPCGSAAFGDDFAEIVRRLIATHAPGAKVIHEPLTVAYSEFNAVCDALRLLLGRLTNEGVYPERVVVDITSGPKTASVAGTVVTLNGGVTVQYVDTEEGNPVARQFNPVWRTPRVG